MGFLSWNTLTGKIMIILIFLAILAILILIITKVVPEIKIISDMIDKWRVGK